MNGGTQDRRMTKGKITWAQTQKLTEMGHFIHVTNHDRNPHMMCCKRQ
jgi:hypothetical protein